MNSIKNLSQRCLSIFFALVVFSGCDSSITNYEPKNQDEREILSILIQYQDARNHFDIEKLLSFLDEHGEFSFECGRMVSKDLLSELLPGLWANIKSGHHEVIPILHECINGDYLKSGELYNLQIEILNATAQISVMFKKDFCRLPQYFSMLRKDNGWQITRTEWGHN